MIVPFLFHSANTQWPLNENKNVYLSEARRNYRARVNLHYVFRHFLFLSFRVNEWCQRIYPTLLGCFTNEFICFTSCSDFSFLVKDRIESELSDTAFINILTTLQTNLHNILIKQKLAYKTVKSYVLVIIKLLISNKNCT